MKKSIYVLCLVFSMIGLPSTGELTYRLTIKGNFKKSVQGKKYFPRNPHFSPVVAISHNKKYQLFPFKTLASLGVKNVAETGNPGELISEVQSAQSKRAILDYETSSPFDGDEVVSVEVKVNKKNPYISLISMIAPSPDWVIGINNLKVIRQGKYLGKKVLPLFAIDAGTDSGKIYTSSDQATQPQGKIKRLYRVGSAVIKKTPFAYLKIEKL